MNDLTDGGLGKHLQPFCEISACIKCLSGDVEMKLYLSQEAQRTVEYIEVTCCRCGHSWNMKTADAGKKKVILEEKVDLGEESSKILAEGMAKEEDEDTKLAPPDKSYEETEEGMKEKE